MYAYLEYVRQLDLFLERPVVKSSLLLRLMAENES